MQGPHTPMSSCSSHRRKNSGELDVFEATRYFSGGTDTAPAPRRAVRGDRMSLDMPTEAKVPTRVELNNHIKEKILKCNKKQPSSPGGKLATFINSFFHQYSASKKKKASKKGDQEESRGRMMMMNATTCYYSSSCTSTTSTGSGFRTPSLHSVSKKREDHHQGYNYKLNKDHEDQYWCGLGVKMRLGDELNMKSIIKGQEIIKGFRDQEEEEEGGESDSSSDLFELKNYHHHEFGDDISSGLPVYGSTDMGVIRRGWIIH